MPPAPLPAPPALPAGLLRRTGLILGAASGISPGCSSPIPDLLRRAEAEQFCPAARIVVKARDDLTVHQMACARQPRSRALREDELDPFWQGRGDVTAVYCGEAPPEIRSDPAPPPLPGAAGPAVLGDRPLPTLGELGAAGAVHVFEVSACGARVLYGCDGDWCSRMGLAP